jgi:hypothetical protein
MMNVAKHYNTWFASFLLISENIDCSINIVIFRSKSLPKSSFSIYFRVTRRVDLFILNFVFFARILQNDFMLHRFQSYKYIYVNFVLIYHH